MRFFAVLLWAGDCWAESFLIAEPEFRWAAREMLKKKLAARDRSADNWPSNFLVKKKENKSNLFFLNYFDLLVFLSEL